MGYLLPFVIIPLLFVFIEVWSRPDRVARGYDRIFKIFRTSIKDIFSGKHERQYVVSISLIIFLLLGLQLQNAIEYSAYEIGTDPRTISIYIPPNESQYLGISYWHKVESVWVNIESTSTINVSLVDLNNPTVRYSERVIEPNFRVSYYLRLPYIFTRLGLIANWRISIENPSDIYAQVRGFIGESGIMADPPPQYVAPIILQLPMELVDLVLFFAFVIPSVVIYRSQSRQRLNKRDQGVLLLLGLGLLILQIGVGFLRISNIYSLIFMILIDSEPLLIFYTKVILILLCIWFYGSKRELQDKTLLGNDSVVAQ